MDLIKRGEEGERHSYEYRVNYEHRELLLSLQLTKDNKIAALDFAGE